jgi:hypothetical protein
VLGRRSRTARFTGPRQEADDLAPADLVERDAMGDLVEPRTGVFGLLECVVVAVRLDERVLRQVRCKLRVSHHPEQVHVDLGMVLGEQRFDERRGLVLVPRLVHRTPHRGARRNGAAEDADDRWVAGHAGSEWPDGEDDGGCCALVGRLTAAQPLM